MTTNRESAIDLMKRLSASGKSYAEIASTLSAGKYPQPTGAPWSAEYVSRDLIAAGIRRRTHAPRGANKSPPPPRDSGTTKYDVLKAIEQCVDISGPSRKALLDLVWKEVNK